MVPIRKNLVSPDRYWLKCPYAMNPTRIIVHNTGMDAPAKNEVSYMVRNGSEVGFHVAVDDVEIVQGIPFDRNAWNAGDGNGKGNREGISIEICYSASGGARFIQALSTLPARSRSSAGALTGSPNTRTTTANTAPTGP